MLMVKLLANILILKIVLVILYLVIKPKVYSIVMNLLKCIYTFIFLMQLFLKPYLYSTEN